jgi:peptidoglycan-associated lipoprotein
MKHVLFAIVAVAALEACADKPPPAPTTAAARVDRPSVTSVSPSLGMAQDLATACNIKFGVVDSAPKFEFDQVELLPEDRNVLEQVAVCVTTGPLKGRALRLIGHADPRGEPEYNMTLGAQRAGSARSFLTHLGVDPKKVATTSRGELDATGIDQAGWRRDRRVDILLQ